ncbi:GTPase HflX [Pseudaquidulcibacter saccharophilus]|uniref:GTPase HflX n=1 Tax=Pseudaquidulcibacter saccharophilus TaxID=2831900 RepID=UPI001EFF59B5|nr:GTPase HflX [Pseudaquidulcibacter saccharophilus]
MYETRTPKQRALVIHPVTKESAANREPDLRLEEAVGLTIALGLEVCGAFIEVIREIRPSTYLGKGKIEDFRAQIEVDEVDIVVIDDEITPVQQRNLEKELNAKVIDRTGLILEIFSLRARTKEGKLQVELARLTYERSRLVRTWTHLERQRGGTGKTGGPGERQIELDRRLIADKIVKLKKELEQVRRTRGLQRQGRERVPYPVVALVGYTNAGKSTLFNNATKAKVLAKDMLFATLDTTSRAMKIKNGREIILSDTVGFITDLPHELIAAFRATLEEVADADILIHVRDISSPETVAQKQDVDEILDKILEDKELIPAVIEAWNKADLLSEAEFNSAQEDAENIFKKTGTKSVLISAENGQGLDELFQAVENELAVGSKEGYIKITPIDGKIRSWLYEKGAILNEYPLEDGDVVLKVILNKINHAKFMAQFHEFVELDFATLRKLGINP